MTKALLFANALGVLLGVALVCWTTPQTSSGAIFLVVVCVTVCNVVALGVSSLASRGRANGPKRADQHE